jgi:predicted glycosyltransferase
MAREGAQLGVPSAYCGHRQMKANDALYELGLMRHVTDLAPS